jgi:hypothetical protein
MERILTRTRFLFTNNRAVLVEWNLLQSVIKADVVGVAVTTRGY